MVDIFPQPVRQGLYHYFFFLYHYNIFPLFYRLTVNSIHTRLTGSRCVWRRSYLYSWIMLYLRNVFFFPLLFASRLRISLRTWPEKNIWHRVKLTYRAKSNQVILRTFALIVSAHRYYASKFACHVMHRARALSTKMNNDRADDHCYCFGFTHLGRSVAPTFIFRSRFTPIFLHSWHH